jgi:small subunit ribosomal protein S9
MVKAKEEPWIWATGRRKTAVARIRMRVGTGVLRINKRDLSAYFPKILEQHRVLAPLQTVGCDKSVDVYANVLGGGLTGQAGAIAMGIARALLKYNGDHEHALREAKFLTRDDRQKERKKYGRRGARRRFQFSKR